MVWTMAMVLVAYVHVLLLGALGVVVYRFASGRPGRRL